MFAFTQCLTLVIAVATVVVKTLNTDGCPDRPNI